MWIKPETMEVAKTHSEVRNILKEVCFPVVMTDEMIESHGMAPVVGVAPSYDPATHMATERPPALVEGVWTQQWEVTALPEAQVAQQLEAGKAQAIARTYTDVDRVYADAVGNRTEEYKDAEADARAFAASGYTSTPSANITSFALRNPTGTAQTNQWAADQIIARADAFASAKLSMREQRFGHQASIREATTQADLDTAVTSWTTYISQLRTQLGLPT